MERRLRQEQELEDAAREASHFRDQERKKKLEAQKQAENDRRLREKRKREEEEELLKNLEGNFGILIQNLRDNNTPLEMVFTGT